jgi:hypothetical protein
MAEIGRGRGTFKVLVADKLWVHFCAMTQSILEPTSGFQALNIFILEGLLLEHGILTT